MNWSQPHTVKSNARRAARKAGADPAGVLAFVKAGKTLFRFPMPAATPKAEKKAKRGAVLRKTAGKPVDALTAAITSKPRNFIAPPAKAIKKPAKPRAAAGKFDNAKPHSTGSKFETVAAMLRRSGGASMPEIVAITGWKPHSARARISVDVSKLLGKGEVIDRRRENGVSVYAIVPSKQLDLLDKDAA